MTMMQRQQLAESYLSPDLGGLGGVDSTYARVTANTPNFSSGINTPTEAAETVTVLATQLREDVQQRRQLDADVVLKVMIGADVVLGAVTIAALANRPTERDQVTYLSDKYQVVHWDIANDNQQYRLFCRLLHE